MEVNRVDFVLCIQMPPIEQQLLPVGTQHVMGLPGAQGGVPPGAISLSTLIDYIIQRTYHDLQVLSELQVLKFVFVIDRTIILKDGGANFYLADI